MNKSIEELKIRAKKLQKSYATGEASAIAKLRRLHSSHKEIQRKTCLNSLAMELGFRDWGHAKAVLEGQGWREADKGTIWYSNKCMPLLNHWFADYREAKAFLTQNPDHYLVPYKRQFIVVDQDYLKTIDLWDGAQYDWAQIKRDAVAGYCTPAWHNLIWKRIHALRPAAA